MNLIYNLGINLLSLALKFGALFNAKLKAGVNGRKYTFATLSRHLNETDKTLWFHCASLGEYEQGLPVFKVLRNHYASYKIVLSFFSPSGYNIRKNTPIADLVVYLPIDTKTNAKQFIELVNPRLSVFVKYDIWPNYLNEIRQKKLKAILISASFRENQHYFKSFGAPFRNALFAFEHIFTQNQKSRDLLLSINYKNVSVSGDTRFDRVSNQLLIDNTLDYIKAFKNNQLCIVAGSTWPEDEDLLINFINTHLPDNTKFIIAPHNINSKQIKSLQQKLKVKSILFSKKEGESLSEYTVFIIDTIGILSKIYSYADIGYVGGGMGSTGLHNVLEPAVFGVPIIIGKHHEEFPEAQALINYGGLFSITNQNELDAILTTLISNSNKRQDFGEKNRNFVMKHKGATNHIMKYIFVNS
ncbi:3-deoxy-D-manno-octulosonic acid transferase [Cognatitamlana onchidii]|uniref:3-deoxy-D-manno-octulosonic acid transferase n=1 Tax=Cognatitamlana onchidii TaxID=2562860 RepID=UPI0010A5B6A2|nr:glycosyltransferase N-terminal domain-containing protein [Algibacter onchidii]